MTLTVTSENGLKLHHEVSTLGEGVASNVVALIRAYAERVSLHEIPPITLSGTAWARPWSEVRTVTPVGGEAGPSLEEEGATGESYRCLVLEIIWDHGSPLWTPSSPAPEDVEGAIAHEMTHLRWWNLPHSPEFDARVLALLRGARFPARGGWPRETHGIMRATRTEAAGFWRERFGIPLETGWKTRPRAPRRPPRANSR